MHSIMGLHPLSRERPTSPTCRSCGPRFPNRTCGTFHNPRNQSMSSCLRFYRPRRSPPSSPVAMAVSEQGSSGVSPADPPDRLDVGHGGFHGRGDRRRGGHRRLLFGTVFAEQVGPVPFLRPIQVDKAGLAGGQVAAGHGVGHLPLFRRLFMVK